MNFDKPHDSMRGQFTWDLYEAMKKDKRIWLVTCDLGYMQFDRIKQDFGDRFINVGASEQCGMGISIGLALEGKIPFFYSITNFALYRPFEWIRNYLNYEKIPVKIIGAGRDKDYGIDGFTHFSEDVKKVLECFPNVISFWPEDKEDVTIMLKMMVQNKKPTFISLKRAW
jgi:transketolase